MLAVVAIPSCCRCCWGGACLLLLLLLWLPLCVAVVSVAGASVGAIPRLGGCCGVGGHGVRVAYSDRGLICVTND